jgi:diguanylate cyclase (GGDEF)-like protein
MSDNIQISCSETAGCPYYDEVNTLKQDIERLNTLVRTDHLTGLYNKQHLMLSLENEMERTRRSSQPTTIMLIDADHFKSVNDLYGHIVGDKVLKNLSSLIQESIRKIDIPCRFGGEEFCIILPSTSSAIGLQVAERLRKMVELHSTILENKEELKITVSIGLATYQYNDELTIEEFLQKGDEQLYLAKNGGRNRTSIPKTDKENQSTVSAEEKSALFSD